jgi:hypothetical protein
MGKTYKDSKYKEREKFSRKSKKDGLGKARPARIKDLTREPGY